MMILLILACELLQYCRNVYSLRVSWCRFSSIWFHLQLVNKVERWIELYTSHIRKPYLQIAASKWLTRQNSVIPFRCGITISTKFTENVTIKSVIAMWFKHLLLQLNEKGKHLNVFVCDERWKVTQITPKWEMTQSKSLTKTTRFTCEKCNEMLKNELFAAWWRQKKPQMTVPIQLK